MTTKKSSNVVWESSRVDQAKRQDVFCQKGATLWLTGLSGSGKSSLAFALENELLNKKYKVYVLDGDNIRHGLNNDLGFSAQDREENIRRVGEVSKLFADSGMIVLSSFISPFLKDRRKVRELHSQEKLKFIEVFLNAPISICESRDSKQLYAKARRGEITDFTGISSPYERPENAEVVILGNSTLEQSVRQVLDYLREHGVIN